MHRDSFLLCVVKIHTPSSRWNAGIFHTSSRKCRDIGLFIPPEAPLGGWHDVPPGRAQTYHLRDSILGQKDMGSDNYSECEDHATRRNQCWNRSSSYFPGRLSAANENFPDHKVLSSWTSSCLDGLFGLFSMSH